MIRKLMIAIGFTCMFSGIHAETISTEKDLTPDNVKNVFGGKTIMKGLYDVGVFYEQSLERNKDCKEQVQIKPVALHLWEKIEYNSDKDYPISGVWTTRFKLSRCGNESTYNALFVADKEEGPKVKPYYPGESLADPRLFKDVITSLMPIAKAFTDKDNCNSLYLEDVKVVDNVKEGAWRESWIVKSCTVHKTFDVSFQPDIEKGTKFTIRLKP